MKNTKFFLIGMVSGMLVLKSIEMMMEKNNMSCKKAMNNFETKMKKKMNQLNEKVQDFDFDEWKQKTVNNLQDMIKKVEGLTIDKVKDKKQVKDLFKQMHDETSCCCECDD